MAIHSVIRSIIEKFHEDKENPILYFSLTPDLLNGYEAFLPDDYAVVDLKDPEVFYSPLAPIMYLLKKPKPSQALITETAYSLQKKNLVQFFSSDLCTERFDTLIPEEISYEKQRLHETLISLLEKKHDRKVLILNAHLISEETTELLTSIEKHKLPLRFILCFDSSCINDLQNRNSFFAEIKVKENFFEFNMNHPQEPESKLPAFDLKKPFEFFYEALCATRIFYSLQTGKDLAIFLSENEKKLNFTEEQTALINLEIGRIAFYLEDYENAVLYFSRVIDYSISGDASFWALYYLAWINQKKANNEDALRFANTIRRQVSTDSFFYCLASGIVFRVRADQNIHDIISQYKYVIELFKNQGLKNNWIYMLIHVPYGMLSDPIEVNNLLKELDIATTEAENLGNQFILSSCYQWRGILIASQGQHTLATTWYKKAAELRCNSGDILSYVRTKNSLAYEYILQGHYENAYNEINSFLPRIIELSERQEILISLFNLSKVIFYARNFEFALEMLQETKRLIINFRQPDSMFYTRHDIQVLIGIIHSIRGDEIKPKVILQRLTMENTKVSMSFVPMADFLKALIALQEGKIEASKKHFEKARVFFNTHKNGQEYLLAFLYFEYAVALYRSKQHEKADFYYNLGIEFANKNNLEYYSSVASNLSIQEYKNTKIVFAPLNINFAQLEGISRHDILKNRLSLQVDGIQFLNKVITAGAYATSSKEYASNFASLFFEYSQCDAIYIAVKSRGVSSWKIIAEKSAYNIQTPSNTEWKQNFTDVVSSSTSLRLKKTARGYLYCNISYDNFTGAVLIIPSENTLLKHENPTILNTSLSHLQTQIATFTHKEYAAKHSIIDELTDLGNKRALLKAITVTSELVDRTFEKNGTKTIFSIASIDLEDFAKYKEIFGEESAEERLIRFATILKERCRKTDSLYRTNEERFVILMQNTTREEARRALERIFENITEKIRFSAGISSNLDTESITQIFDVLEKSEDALRTALSEGKGLVKIWGLTD